MRFELTFSVFQGRRGLRAPLHLVLFFFCGEQNTRNPSITNHSLSRRWQYPDCFTLQFCIPKRIWTPTLSAVKINSSVKLWRQFVVKTGLEPVRLKRPILLGSSGWSTYLMWCLTARLINHPLRVYHSATWPIWGWELLCVSLYYLLQQHCSHSIFLSQGSNTFGS